MSQSTTIAGQKPKSTTRTLTSNFGFIPRKKARDENTDTNEITAQIRNLIVDPEQAAPVTCFVPLSRNSNVVIAKELQHNPKSILGRKRVIATNNKNIDLSLSSSEIILVDIDDDNNYNNDRNFKAEQSTPAMVKAVIDMYPTIFSASKPNRLRCDICSRSFATAKVTHAKRHLATDLHKNNTIRRFATNAKLIQQRNYIEEYFKKSRAKGETLDMETLEWRFNTVRVFLKQGVPMNKMQED